MDLSIFLRGGVCCFCACCYTGGVESEIEYILAMLAWKGMKGKIACGTPRRARIRSLLPMLRHLEG